jgi:hypothetical protein|nr:MAG TPA_asm: Leucine-rich repeat [Caudoviricetes sp.]
MRNLNQIMRKLQRALLTKRLQVKIDTHQFYSAEQKRMITVYTLTTPTLGMVRGEWKTRDYEIMHTASQFDVVMALKEIWEALEDWE